MLEVPDYLAPWMARQRWFAGKGRTPQLLEIGGFSLGYDESVRVRVRLVLDRASNPLLYQVPLTERRTPLQGGEAALVATENDADGPLYIYDGPRDPAFASALLGMVLQGGEALAEDGSGPAAFGHRDLAEPDGIRFPQVRSSKVLSGEQSNTSIVYEMTDADGSPAMPIICKLFRALHDGENPDVVLTGALGAAGSAVVPRTVGYVTGRWRDTAALGGVATGHLAFAQEFLPGVQDAWKVALAAVEVGEDFAERAYALGEATAEMHETLAGALPTRVTTPFDIATVVTAMRTRFELAASEVPALGVYRERLNTVYARAQASPWPPLQRIHGDFHLGQVLSVPDRGWVVLDFEGEPLRDMRERSAPDCPLRDLAGMLRSFDYVAGSYALAHPGQSAAEWASAARNAFIDGYIARSGRDLREHRALLDAFEIDKAVYEALYEVRNRPNWLSIPSAAVDRLVTRSSQRAS
ncbi:maltokinase N-terminal cap-like domain-containing protein [Lacisediminihabitans changchengi]|uniref:Maltokinase n=1 Tax=Lacisediminihabitans changchengi TaxID=2787634 RepID=A0A934SRB3_9MICO|nr:phosphotransferase [Lacisediminihabitans changchengi]MBK4347555.1 phosphotransferase [Lacisediminihabitans changchengi]